MCFVDSRVPVLLSIPSFIVVASDIIAQHTRIVGDCPGTLPEMTSTSRSLQHAWDTAWTTAPPQACETLRNLNGAVAWGQTCVFTEEDNDPIPFSINTACMPWVTSNVYPSPSAFYSPATACPAKWTAVATQTAANGEGSDNRWIDGEIGLQCCPDGFQADGRDGCRPEGSGRFPVVECGEADAEENELRTYDGGAWPATATPSITALHLRYQPSDTGGTNSPTASSTEATSTGATSSQSPGGGSGGDSGNGISTGAIAAIATIIPLVIIIGALAMFLLWRRKKKNGKAAIALKNLGDEKDDYPLRSVDDTANQAASTRHDMPKGTTAAAYYTGSSQHPHETPEWNVEMDAVEAERLKVTGTSAQQSSSPVSPESGVEATELAGLARVPRKPIAPIELDSTPVIPEVGDAYIPYRPGRE